MRTSRATRPSARVHAPGLRHAGRGDRAGKCHRYGLQAGIFTGSLASAFEASSSLEFGGVTINEAPTFRADQMPYGGVKDSGNTREGPAWAVREMTEERLVVVQL